MSGWVRDWPVLAEFMTRYLFGMAGWEVAGLIGMPEGYQLAAALFLASTSTWHFAWHSWGRGHEG